MRMVLGLPPDLQMLLMTRPLRERLAADAVRSGDADRPDPRPRRRGGGDAVAGRVPEDVARRLAAPAQLLRRRLERAREGRAWLEGPLTHALERAASAGSRRSRRSGS